MEATAPTAPPQDLADAPASDRDDAAAAPTERLSWRFPIGCSLFAAVAFAITRAIAPPAIPPAEPPFVQSMSPLVNYGEPIGESTALPMPFITTPSIPQNMLLPSPSALNPRVVMGALSVTGRLPPEVIRRVVRQNHGRFRACYAAGLRQNPLLAGRVGVRFVIDRDGDVTAIRNGGSDLPDANVVSCIVRAMSGLSFPQPDRGIVTVVYPLQLRPS